METASKPAQGQRDLLGLRPPTQLVGTGLGPAARTDRATAPDPTPARPDYPVISSGWADEDTGPASKTSDMMTAVRAALMLLAVMVGIGLLIG